MNNVRSVAREANISRCQVHQIMEDFIEYKLYMMHSVQQLQSVPKVCQTSFS